MRFQKKEKRRREEISEAQASVYTMAPAVSRADAD
jgi:hypothetical protein